MSGDRAIQIFSSDQVTEIDSGDTVDFGTATVDVFGRGPSPAVGPIDVRNATNGPVRVVVAGDGTGGLIPLFGPTREEMEPAPANTFVLETTGREGDTEMGYIGLDLLDLAEGNRTTTTIIFSATAAEAPP